MVQSAPLAVALVLLAGVTARAQSPGREPRQRTVTVTDNPAEPPHEVHVSPELPTLLLFNADIRKEAVKVDGARIRVVDAGARSLVVQPVGALGEGERQELEVPFVDGRAPARAVFTLVAHSASLDTVLHVTRQEPTVPTCPTEARGNIKGPEDFLLLGFMDKGGVATGTMHGVVDSARGFFSKAGVAYRGKGWLMFQLEVRNTLSPQPWVPMGATLTSKTGVKLRGRVVLQEPGATHPGEYVKVLVVTEGPPPSAGLKFTLELSGPDGRTYEDAQVTIPAPPKGSPQ